MEELCNVRVEEDLVVGRQDRVAVREVRQKENDGISGPDDHREQGDLVEERGSLGSDELGRSRSLNKELEDLLSQPQGKVKRRQKK